MSSIHSKPASDAYRRGFDSTFKKSNRLMVILYGQDGEVTTLFLDEPEFPDQLTLNGQQYLRQPGTNTYDEIGDPL